MPLFSYQTFRKHRQTNRQTNGKTEMITTIMRIKTGI